MCKGEYDLTEHALQQVQLGLRYGGLGMHSLALHACAAYIDSVSLSDYADLSNHHLLHAVGTFNNYGSVIVDSRMSQKVLVLKVDMLQFMTLRTG